MTQDSKFLIKRMTINSLELSEPEARIAKELFPLPTNEQDYVINDFFSTHFNETRQGKSTKSCKFIDEDATIKIKINRYKVSKSDEEFLKLSKEITENLFKVMKNSKSKSDGTFFVLEVENSFENSVFMIKLDPKDGIQVDLKDMTIKVLENMLPDSNDRVHKCAIVKFDKNESDEAELYVMDKQQKEGETAKFFLDTFLQAAELTNNKIMTNEAIKSTKENILSILPDVNMHDLLDSIDKEFNNNSRIELATSYKNILEDVVPKDRIDRELYIEESSKYFVSEYLRKNPDHHASFVVEKKDNVVKYRGDKNTIFFRVNSGVQSFVNVEYDSEGNALITIDKSLGFKKEI